MQVAKFIVFAFVVLYFFFPNFQNTVDCMCFSD